jgi:hypothetical protein
MISRSQQARDISSFFSSFAFKRHELEIGLGQFESLDGNDLISMCDLQFID